jgi:hypothetical protein
MTNKYSVLAPFGRSRTAPGLAAKRATRFRPTRQDARVFVRTIMIALAIVAAVSACGATVAGRPPPTGNAAVPHGTMADGPGANADTNHPENRALDPSVNVRNLSDAEKGELCDHWIAIFGGYGATYPCENGHMEGPRDRAECVSSSFPSTCAATVGQVESCASALIPSHGCVLRDGPTPPECAPLMELCSYRRPARAP